MCSGSARKLYSCVLVFVVLEGGPHVLARAAHEENGLEEMLNRHLNNSQKIQQTHHSCFCGALLRLEEDCVPCVTLLTWHIGMWELYKSICQQMLLSRCERIV